MNLYLECTGGTEPALLIHWDEILRLRNIQYEKGKLSIIDLLTVIKERNTAIINNKIEDYNLRYLEYLVKYYTTNIN